MALGPAAAVSLALNAVTSWPAAGMTPIAFTVPGSVLYFCRSASLKKIAACETGPDAAAMPLTVKLCVAPWTSTSTVCPTWTPATAADSESMTTWPALVGWLPPVNAYGANSAEDQPWPREVVSVSTREPWPRNIWSLEVTGLPPESTTAGKDTSVMALSTPGVLLTASMTAWLTRTCSASVYGVAPPGRL